MTVWEARTADLHRPAPGSIERYLSDISEVDDFAEVDRLLEDYVRDLGFERFAYHVLRPPETYSKRTWIQTYPSEWAARYKERDYKNNDPIMRGAVANLTPFRWDEANERALEQDRFIFHEATEFGLQNGVTVPIHGPGQCLATLNLATDAGSGEFDDIWAANRHTLHLVAIHTHETVLRLVYNGPEDCVVHLSPRERECLLWASRGKTAWETAEILKLAEDTVTKYLKTACQKLGVFTKTHAVVKAILLGLILP